MGLEEEECIELLRLFIDTSNQDLEKLKKAVLEGNAVLAAEAAHSLKGASLNLNLTWIHEKAREMEQKIKQADMASVERMTGSMEELLRDLAGLVRPRRD